MNYYNEFDPKAAAWLRELIRRGLIPNGVVDERSITEISPNDLKDFTQCHFFAGIGGWSLALKLAGWPEDKPVWTGSCPCQPFSVAGKGKGVADERHLWPVFAKLISECHPPVVFGEQVASAAGRKWLAGVFADLERVAYRPAGADLCAAGVASPHIRQRLFWLADSERDATRLGGVAGAEESAGRSHGDDHDGCGSRLDDGWQRVVFSGDTDEDGNCPVCGIDYADCECPGPTQDDLYEYDERNGVLYARRLDHAQQPRLEGHAGDGDNRDESGRLNAAASRPASAPGCGCWSNFSLIPCADGKARRIEPGLAPLAHGVPARVVRLRGYGNAIVPQVAAQFIAAYLEAADIADAANDLL